MGGQYANEPMGCNNVIVRLPTIICPSFMSYYTPNPARYKLGCDSIASGTSRTVSADSSENDGISKGARDITDSFKFGINVPIAGLALYSPRLLHRLI